MVEKQTSEAQVKQLRTFRKYHRFIGLALATILLVSTITGILLAWKKDVPVLQPPAQKGQSEMLKDWISLEAIAAVAQEGLVATHPDQADNPIDKMDVRPSKGMVKVLFEKGYWEVQVDGSTGSVLSVARRHSDWIEALHDGSIISDGFKLVSMSILGFGLMVMILTGFWLWYGPKLIRRQKRRR